jgi:hypothetical protein
MGIKRYTADADNTITNAYKSNLRTRATASNMGCSQFPISTQIELLDYFPQAEA